MQSAKQEQLYSTSAAIVALLEMLYGAEMKWQNRT